MVRRHNPQQYAYGIGGTFRLPDLPVAANRAPLTTDVGYDVGTLWVDTDANTAYIYCGAAAGSAVWALASPGASDVDTINGLSPAAGNIIIDGGTNITDVNAGNTVTLNLDDAITLATSVTSPIYASAAAMAINPVGALTVTGGAAIDINAAAGSDITIQLGDAAGANILEIENSASAAVATIDSTGIATFVGMDGILGGVTPAAATGTTITGNTSVVTPLYTAPAATDLQITSIAGQDIHIQMGDNAGANYVYFDDSDGAAVFTIDSNGGVGTFVGLTSAGGAISLNDNSNFNTSINTGTSTGTVTVGSANAGAITVDSGAGVSIDGATASNFTVTGASEDLTLGATGGSINIQATEADAQAILIYASDAAGGIDIDCGTGGIDILSTGGGFSIDGQAASNITVTSAGLDLSVQGVGCAVNVTSTETENDAIYIEASAANGGVEINAGTGGIRIGDEADCTGLTFGNIAPTANRNITIGSGTVVTASVTDDISIGDGGATTNADSIKSVDINNGGVTLGQVLTYIAGGAVTSGTHTTEIACGNVAAGTATLNLSDGTGTKTVNLGNADANTTFNIDAATVINDDVNANFDVCTGTSTGAITLGNIATSTAVAIQSSTTIDIDNAGAFTINSTGGTINIGNDDVDQNMGFGTDGERTVTVGSTNGAAALVLQSGTGEITMTGTVKQIDAELVGYSGVYIPSFTQNAQVNTAANTGGVATGATGDENNIMLQTGANMVGYVIGAGQTILQPVMSANGLVISADQTNTEGMEMAFPYMQYTIGTSDSFFFEVDLYINDLDGSDPYLIGFRKTEAFAQDWQTYDTYATIGMIASSSAANVVLATELNGGGTTVTNTTDAYGGDGSHRLLRVLVDGSGNVTYTIDGVAPSVTAAFQFDNGDVVIPTILIRHSANPTDVAIQSMRLGYQV